MTTTQECACPEPHVSDDRRRAIVNVGWSALQKWFVRLAGVITFFVIARLLSPEEIGLAALALAVVGFLTVVTNAGMSTFLVQSADVERPTVGTAFWASNVLAAVAAGAIALGAGPIGGLLDEPGVAPILRVLSLTLVIAALGSVPTALLTREMRFKVLSVRGMAASLASAVVGVGTALAGAGVWALVWQHLTLTVLNTVWVWAALRWTPPMVFSRDSFRSMWKFGTTVAGVNMLQAARDRVDAFLIGGIAGAELLGYWSIATRILQLVAEVSSAIFNQVAFPLFAKVRDDRERFQRALESAVSMSMTLLVPSLTALALVSPVLLPLLFGSQWEPSIAPAQILALAYLVGGLAFFNRGALLSHGKAGTEWLITAVGLALHVATVLLFVRQGLVTLAWAITVETALVVVIGVVALRRAVGVRAWVYARPLRVVVAGGVMAGAMVLFDLLVTLPGELVEALVAVAVGVVVYAGTMLVVNRSLVQEIRRDAVRLLRR